MSQVAVLVLDIVLIPFLEGVRSVGNVFPTLDI